MSLIFNKHVADVWAEFSLTENELGQKESEREREGELAE